MTSTVAAVPHEAYVANFFDRMRTGYNIPAADFLKVCDFFHKRNVRAGWWADIHTGEDLHGKRDMGELLALLHSEVSEALEASRKDLWDDKIPTRKGLEVELADALIRLFDTVGSLRRVVRISFKELINGATRQPALPKAIKNVGAMLCKVHGMISGMDIVYETGSTEDFIGTGARTFAIIMDVGRRCDLDLAGAVFEKAAYNLTRPDHKPENRRLEHGKRI